MKKSGFTLLECLLYLSVFSVFVTGLVTVLSTQKLRLAERERDFIVLRDTQFIFDKVEWLLNTADTITVIDSDTLEVQHDTETLRLELVDERLCILSLDRLPEPISPSYVTIEELLVTEESLSSARRVNVRYVIQGTEINHLVYVSS